MTDFNAVDYDNPCAVLAVLQPAYYRLLAGGTRETVKFQAGNGETQEVTYAKSNISSLRAEILRLTDACNAKNGIPKKRYAIRGGLGR